MNQLNLRVNNYLISLNQELNESGLKKHKFKKAGFFKRLLIKPAQNEVVCWSKNCGLKYLNDDFENTINPILDTKSGANLMYGTSAFLFFKQNKLTKFIFQIIYNKQAAQINLQKLEEKLIKYIGKPLSISRPSISWEIENQKLTLQYPLQEHGYLYLMNKFDVFQNANLEQIVNLFNMQLRRIRVTLCGDLYDEYSKEYDIETAKVVAANVVNYLQGEDIEEIYQKTTGRLRATLGQIKNQVPQKADNLLKTNEKVKQLIVYTLRMKVVLNFSLYGKDYLLSSEKVRIENILKEYGPEYPEEASPELYSQIVDRFLKLPHKINQQQRI